MDRLKKISYRFLLYSATICGVFVSKKTTAQTGQNYYVEAEDFQFPGEWSLTKETGVTGTGALLGSNARHTLADAYTVIKINSQAEYTVWTRSRDFAQNAPKSRSYNLFCNGQKMEKSGAHGEEGYLWENVGNVTMVAGENLLQLKNTSFNFARCDAIFFTTDGGYNPNTAAIKPDTFKVMPFQVAENHAVVNVDPPSAVGPNETVLGKLTMANDKIRLSFKQGIDNITGRTRIAAVTEVLQDGQWVTVGQNIEEHRIFLVKAKTPKIKFTDYYASWSDTASVSTFVVNGRTYRTLDQIGLRNPFLSGKLLLFSPSAVVQTSPQELGVTYTAADGSVITGTWKLKPGSTHFELSLQYAATEEGFYSFGISAFQGAPNANVKNVQLSPMFNYKRISDFPVIVPGAMTPQPQSIVELNKNNKSISTFITGSLTDFPLDWAQDTSSRIGFSLKGELNTVQPIAFAPLLGLKDSKLLNGQSLKRTFNIGAISFYAGPNQTKNKPR